MNVKHLICRLLVAFLPLVTANAAQLSPAAALSRVNAKHNSALKSAVGQMQLKRTVTDGAGNKILYIFRNTLNGRLSFVSADDCAKPLLGYTDGFVADADSLPAALEEWLDTYTRQIGYGIANPTKIRPLTLPAINNNGLKSTEKDFPSIDVLLPVEWGTIPFNGLCPEVNGVRTKVGCVAVAMYQIMAYWRYPDHGRDTVMYSSVLNGKDTVFQHSLENSVYDWDAMLNDLDSEKGKAAAAILGRDCSFSVHATFGVNNTGARSPMVPKALTRYFGYDSSMVCVGRSDNDMWFRIIYNELANGRPVYYSGSGSYGHAFVCDGYNANDTTFHFNFDWYGSCNGFFSLSAINPENGDQFNETNMAVIGIQPPGTFKKGDSHVFAYGDLMLKPYVLAREKCHTLNSIGATTTSSGLCSQGVFFAPPIYPSAKVGFLMVNEDSPKDTLLLNSTFGKSITNYSAFFEYGLFEAFDFNYIDNAYSFFKSGSTYSVCLVYKDTPDDDWHYVEYPKGGNKWAKIRFNDNGTISAVADSVLPMLVTDWVARHMKSRIIEDEYGNRCDVGTDAAAIGQIVYALQAPPKVFGEIRYDDIAVDTTFAFNFSKKSSEISDEDVLNLSYISMAIRTMFDSRQSTIHSIPGMVYGLHKNMGLGEVQYASRKFYTTANWIEMLDHNLQLGCPVYYTGYHIFGSDSTRKAFVVDGHNNTHSYHVNFCNGGVGDRYMNIDVASPTCSNPGNSDLCFPFGQGMLTDFLTSCSVNTTKLPTHPFMLMTPLVVNADSSLTSLTVGANESFNIKFTLADCTRESTGYDANASVAVGVGLFRSGSLLKVLTSEEVLAAVTHHSLSLSIGSLMAGTYELALVTRVGTAAWERVYNNAPNSIELTVKQNKCTLAVPVNPSFGAKLALRAPMEVFTDSVKGPMVRLPLSNYTHKNYEDVLRLMVKVGDQTVVSDAQMVAVYGATNMTYDIILPDNLVGALQQGGTLLGYYFKNDEGWLPLQEETSILKVDAEKADGISGVRVFSASGALLRSFSPADVENEYASFLSTLPVGVYVVVENGSSRKFVKYAR